jgi:hypothetical protein
MMMNKRLKELYMQTLSESENMRWNIEDAERFAKLIVDECVENVRLIGMEIRLTISAYRCWSTLELKKKMNERLKELVKV